MELIFESYKEGIDRALYLTNYLYKLIASGRIFTNKEEAYEQYIKELSNI